MIIKIKSHKRPSFGKILQYMMNDTGRLFDKNRQSFVITHNLKGNSIKEWEHQYRANEENRLRRRKDSVYLTHEILSWHKDDSKEITLAKMESMAREYIKKRNPRGIYVAVPHFDKNHYHIHICSSGIEYKTGKSLRLSKAELLKLKKKIQQFQIEKYPELSKSVVKHGTKNNSRLSEKEYQVKLRTGRQTEKEKITSLLKTCFNKAKSKDSFFKLLKQSGLNTYERSSKITGIIHNNYKFRFSRLGFTEEKLEELSITENRNKTLGSTRENSRERNITRNR